MKNRWFRRGLNYAIVDEVDQSRRQLRTPLIISDLRQVHPTPYSDANVFILTLNEDDYEKEAGDKAVSLQKPGIKKVALYFSM